MLCVYFRMFTFPFLLSKVHGHFSPVFVSGNLVGYLEVKFMNIQRPPEDWSGALTLKLVHTYLQVLSVTVFSVPTSLWFQWCLPLVSHDSLSLQVSGQYLVCDLNSLII